MTNPPPAGDASSNSPDTSGQIGQCGGWLDQPASNFTMALMRRIRIGFVVLFCVGIASLLLWELLEPFEHTNAHLLLVSGERHALDVANPSTDLAEADLLGRESDRKIPPMDFVAEDLSSFQSIQNTLSIRLSNGKSLAKGDLRELLDLRRLQSTLENMADDRGHVLLMYLSPRITLDDGESSVELNVRPGFIDDDQRRFEEILGTISRSEAAVKILFVDAGRIERDPARGLVLNEFPRLLERLVHQTNDSRLWVLSSNRQLENSHISRAMERSVFGWFIELGLDGMADLNNDFRIDLDELFRFVSTEVSAYVRQTTGGTQTQTPNLLWGGGSWRDQRPPVVLPVAYKKAREVSLSDPDQWLQSTRRQSIGASFLSVSNGPIAFTPRSDLTRTPSLLTDPLSNLRQPTVPSTLEIRGLGTISKNSANAPKAPAAASTPSAKTPTSESEESKTAEKSGDTQKQADSSSSDSMQSDKKSGNESVDAVALATLFADVWKMREDLERVPWDGLNPARSAVEEWNALMNLVLMHERSFRAAKVADLRQISTILNTIREGMQALSRNELLAYRTGQDERASLLFRRIYDLMNQRPASTIQPHSFGMAEFVSRRTGRSMKGELQEAIQKFDEIIKSGTSEQFQEWLEKSEPHANGFVELQLAHRLAADSQLSWPTRQFALQVCRTAEITASLGLGLPDWVGVEIDEAERLRKIGERTLLDQIGADREDEGLKWLRQSFAKYQRVVTRFGEIQFAELLCDRLVNRMPMYVKWHNESGRQALPGQRGDDIRRVGDDLQELIRLVDVPSPNAISEIQSVSTRLSLLGEKVDSEFDAAGTLSQSRTAFLPGDHLQIEALLKTTLPAASARLGLLQKLIEIDRRNVSQLNLPRDYPASQNEFHHAHVDWDWPSKVLELELLVPQLGAINFPALPADLATIRENLQEFKNSVVDSRQTNSDHTGDVWEKYRRLSTGLKRFYQSWMIQVAATVRSGIVPSSAEEWDERCRALRAARRALQMKPAHLAIPVDLPSPTMLLEEIDVYRLLCWNAKRYDRMRSGTPREEAADLLQLSRSCRAQAARLPHQMPPADAATTKIEWNGPNEISLAAVPSQTVELQLEWKGASRTPSWISVHFESEKIQIKSDSETPVLFNENTAFVEPQVPVGKPASVELTPDRTSIVRLAIGRRGNATGTSKLIVYAMTSQGIARKDISISLSVRPSIELFVDGIARSWTVEDERLQFHPFANRTTVYSLGLINRIPQVREVSVKCLAPRRPIPNDISRTELPVTEANGLVERLGPCDVLVDVANFTLPADNSPVKIPFPKPAAEAAEPQSKSLPAPHGMILVVTDQKAGKSLVDCLQVTPQRPRRFLKPLVRYSADRQRIEISVVPIDRALLPSGGVKIHGELLEGIADDASRELDAEIVAPRYEANLFVEVASRAEKSVTLTLSVDDYPRAFTFRVPCETNTGDIPEAMDVMAVSLISPKPPIAYQSPLDDVPVELQVDVPDGAFRIPGDVLEVGIDRNNDRDFRNEPVLALTTDRQVENRTIQFGPDGYFSIFASIGDLKVRVPATGVRNANVQLLARLTVSDRTVWSRPVPVTFDGELPRIQKVRFRPAGPVAIGVPLGMIVSASDNDLSGVARIEAAFDTDRTGEIGATAKLILADPSADGNWEAVVPTADLKPGLQSLLIRAVDRVGNVGPVTKVKLVAMTAEDAAKAAAVPVAITGLVTYGDKPVGAIQISAEKADGPKIDPAETDENGLFQVNGLVPGKWKIKAKGVVRNKMRTAESELVIEPGVAPPPLKFKVK